MPEPTRSLDMSIISVIRSGGGERQSIWSKSYTRKSIIVIIIIIIIIVILIKSMIVILIVIIMIIIIIIIMKRKQWKDDKQYMCGSVHLVVCWIDQPSSGP